MEYIPEEQITERVSTDYDMEDLRKVSPTPALNLEGITEIACYEPRNGEPYMVFFCEATRRYRGPCPHCGSGDHYVHAKLPENRLVHDVNVGLTQVDIYLTVRRHKCNECGGTFVEPFSSVVDGRQMTQRLHNQIRSLSFRHSFTDVAAASGFSSTTVASIFDEYAEKLEASRGPVIAPRVLGIDEKHIVHAMRGMFVDIETGRLLEMTEENKANDIIRTIESMVDYDKNIEIVTMDMSNGYRSYVEQCLPYAAIIVDKYHVIQDLLTKTRKAKTAVTEYLEAKVAAMLPGPEKAHKEDVLKLFTGTAYLFKYNHNNRPARHTKIMADVCAEFPEINHLRLLKDGFERIYDTDDRAEAEQRYREWEKLVPGRGSRNLEAWEKEYGLDGMLYQEFRVFQSTVLRWYDYIFGYFDDGCQFTNAATEGLNQLVDGLNRLGNGYGFKRLRARALFCNNAAPLVRYSAKKLKRAVPPKRDSGLPSTSRMDFGFEMITVTLPTKTTEEYISIEADEWIPAPEPLSVFNFAQHTIFTEEGK